MDMPCPLVSDHNMFCARQQTKLLVGGANLRKKPLRPLGVNHRIGLALQDQGRHVNLLVAPAKLFKKISHLLYPRYRVA